MTKTRECGTKRRHEAKQAAEDQKWALIRAGTAKRAMSVYKCAHCGGWHVGHKKRARR